jgi:helix-turn-helix protein
MYASITESKTEKGRYGVEIGNSKETIVPWQALEDSEQTLRDVILLMGFDTVGKWSLRNKVSRVLVRSVTAPKNVEPLDSPAPETTEFLE